RAARGPRPENLGRADLRADRRRPRPVAEHGSLALPLRPGEAPRATDGGPHAMNADRDPLEVELEPLTPREPSPELRRRIAGRLAVTPVALSRPWRSEIILALAAAVLAAVVLGLPRPAVIVRPPEPPAVVRADPGPSLAAYERALARSPAAL